MRVGDTIYLDYQASTPLDPDVLDVMERSWREDFANPHAAEHTLGWRSNAAVEAAADHLAAQFGLAGDDVVFTSGATEANWLALKGYALGAMARGRAINRLVVSAAEHKSVRTAAENAAQAVGASLVVLDIDRRGGVEPQRLIDSLEGKAALVSIMAVGNETGAINDIAALRQACGEEVVLHVDASQAPAAMDLDELSLHADLITLSSHKAYGPKGIGALIVAPEIRSVLQPLMPGGSQQGGLRPGTMPTPLCIGFAAAMAKITKQRAERLDIAALRDRFVDGLIVQVGGVTLVGDRRNRHPGNACVKIEAIDAADLLSALQPKIAASTQSACNSGTMEPSEVLLAMGLGFEAARQCIRFSLGRFSDTSQIDEAVDLIARTVRQRRDLHRKLTA